MGQNHPVAEPRANGTNDPILIAGFPRSGTTWVARVLTKAGHNHYVHEPDNERLDPFALRAKRPLGRFPVLEAKEPGNELHRLWEGVFTGGEAARSLPARAAWRLLNGADRDALTGALDSPANPLPAKLRLATRLAVPLQPGSHGRRIVAKTVHAVLCLDWIEAHWDVATIVVTRHPLNVLASWLDLDLADRDRDLDRSERVRARYTDRWGVAVPTGPPGGLERASWQLGVFLGALEGSGGRRRTVVSHEDVCRDPVPRFRSLSERVGMGWTDLATEFVERSNVPGAGFDTLRLAAAQIDRWRRTLDAEDVERARRVLEQFPISGWPNDGSAP